MALNQVKKADTAALGATLGGLAFLLLGERVLVASDGLAKVCTWLAVLGLVGALVERGWSLQNSPDDRKPAARVFLGLSATTVLALFLYGLSTSRGRELVNVPKPKLDAPDDFGAIVTIAWVSLLVVSVLASLFGSRALRCTVRSGSSRAASSRRSERDSRSVPRRPTGRSLRTPPKRPARAPTSRTTGSAVPASRRSG